LENSEKFWYWILKNLLTNRLIVKHISLTQQLTNRLILKAITLLEVKKMYFQSHLSSTTGRIWFRYSRHQGNLHLYILYTLIFCLSVYLFVSNKRQNGWKFVRDLTWPQGRFMNDHNFKNWWLNFFIFVKF